MKYTTCKEYKIMNASVSKNISIFLFIIIGSLIYSNTLEAPLVFDDEQNIKNVLKFTRDWTAKEIRVYGFLPPTCKQMYELENEISGFDQEDFVEQFVQAGGIWLKVDPCGYFSFDGSHLSEDSAIRFSNDLARLIKQTKEQ